jgi:glycosyltransferase involved in cell wall biosynthesis
MKIVGNANFMYPPKWYLGQRVGLKAHEDVIDALGLVINQRTDVLGVLIGGTAPGSVWYQRRLRERARAAGGDRILMAGYLPVEEIRQMWPDFDVAVHVPISENCGGVGEPMLAGVPTIAGRVGGLPEIIIDGLTGTLVSTRQPEELARAILQVLNSPGHYLELAKNAQRLARRMAADERLGQEVCGIYSHVLKLKEQPPCQFDPGGFLSSQLAREISCAPQA